MNIEPKVLEQFTTEEKEVLRVAQEEIKYAIKLKRALTAVCAILMVADIAFLTFYIIYFVVIEDGNWYNYIEFWHFLMDLGLLFALFNTEYVHRNLKILIILSAVALFFDLFANAYLRPTQYKDVTSLDPHKKNIKEILFIFQFFFTIDSFLVLITSIVFAFGVGLEGGVLLRYKQLAVAESQFMSLAILVYLTTIGLQAIVSNALEQQEEVEQQKKRVDFVANLTSKQISPLVTASSNIQQQQQTPSNLLQVVAQTPTSATFQTSSQKNGVQGSGYVEYKDLSIQKTKKPDPNSTNIPITYAASMQKNPPAVVFSKTNLHKKE